MPDETALSIPKETTCRRGDLRVGPISVIAWVGAVSKDWPFFVRVNKKLSAILIGHTDFGTRLMYRGVGLAPKVNISDEACSAFKAFKISALEYHDISLHNRLQALLLELSCYASWGIQGSQ